MPVHRFRIDCGRILEQYVELTGECLSRVWGEPSTDLQSAVERTLETLDGRPDDFESELNLRAAPWLRELCQPGYIVRH